MPATIELTIRRCMWPMRYAIFEDDDAGYGAIRCQRFGISPKRHILDGRYLTCRSRIRVRDCFRRACITYPEQRHGQLRLTSQRSISRVIHLFRCRNECHTTTVLPRTPSLSSGPLVAVTDMPSTGGYTAAIVAVCSRLVSVWQALETETITADHIQAVACTRGMTPPPHLPASVATFPQMMGREAFGVDPVVTPEPCPLRGLSNLEQACADAAGHRPVVQRHSFLFRPERWHGFAACATSVFSSTPPAQDAGSPTHQSCLDRGRGGVRGNKVHLRSKGGAQPESGGAQPTRRDADIDCPSCTCGRSHQFNDFCN